MLRALQRIFELAQNGVRRETKGDPVDGAPPRFRVATSPVAANPCDELASARSPSWYLDPLVAAQKRAAHLELIDRWMDPAPGLLLKTDLFEEAYGPDRLLPDLRSRCGTAIALDINAETVRRAQANTAPCERDSLLVGDLRQLAISSNSVDLVISNSSLDHFRSEAEFRGALAELARVVRPGGQLIITADNPVNPLYWPLRWLSRTSWAPFFPLGYTPTSAGLVRRLRESGLEVNATAALIHNPRGISTLLFVALRRLLGERANRPVRVLLRIFAVLGRLPTRRLTACFVAASARKPRK